MGRLFSRITSISLTLFLAFVLAMAMLIMLGFFAPDVLNWVINGADAVEGWLTNTSLPNRYNNFLRLFMGEEQITFLFFTILARILIAIVATSFSAAFFPKSHKRNFLEKTFG